MNKILIGSGIGIVLIVCLFAILLNPNSKPEYEAEPNYSIAFKDFQVSDSYEIQINKTHTVYGLYIMNFTIENIGDAELTNIFLEYSVPYLVFNQKCCCIDSLLPNAEKRVSYVNWIGPYPDWCGSPNPGCKYSNCWSGRCNFFWSCDQLQEKWKDREPTDFIKPVYCGNETYIMAYCNFWHSYDCSFADQAYSF